MPQTTGGRKSSAKNLKAVPSLAEGAAALSATVGDQEDGAETAAQVPNESSLSSGKDKKGRPKSETLYYRVKCRDNGVGMPHDKARRLFQFPCGKHGRMTVAATVRVHL